MEAVVRYFLDIAGTGDKHIPIAVISEVLPATKGTAYAKYILFFPGCKRILDEAVTLQKITFFIYFTSIQFIDKLHNNSNININMALEQITLYNFYR